MLICAAVLIYQSLKKENEFLIFSATIFGVLAGITQVLGLIRWVFVVPVLANSYTNPNSSEATKDAVVMIFETLHQYAGVAIGEHLGQLFTAVWILLISTAIKNSAIFSRWQSVAGIVVSAAMFCGLVGGFSTVISFQAETFGKLTMLSFIALSLWLISLGANLIWQKSPRGSAAKGVKIYEI